jgi:hypothetical protein
MREFGYVYLRVDGRVDLPKLRLSLSAMGSKPPSLKSLFVLKMASSTPLPVCASSNDYMPRKRARSLVLDNEGDKSGASVSLTGWRTS